MVKVPSKIPALNTLKLCLRFLEWLKRDTDMQGKVAGELEKRLKMYYSKDSDVQNIKHALSSFLGGVSHFYDKLCKNAQPTNYMANKPGVVLYTLLACIPKLLSAVHFLWYNVDGKFKNAGGGEWANEPVGQLTSAVSKIDSYLIETSFDKYVVIPGGFKKSELKPGDQNGYGYGSVMADNLPKLVDELHKNFFSDVLVTSVLTTAGSQPSNTANALALLKIFCEVVHNDQDNKVENALNGYINEYGNCIKWEQLKAHCSHLKKYLGDIFDAGVLSHTGHSPAVKTLNKERFARNMTRWLKEYLDRVRASLKEIKPHNKTNASDYFNKHFFPYGFIFDSHYFDTESDRSQALEQKWQGVVGLLSKYGEGLDETVGILKGVPCKNHNHVKTAYLEEADDKEDEIVVLEELNVGDDLGVEGAQNQGKKAEGTPNQGKKAEGAQNQGKKAEGASDDDDDDDDGGDGTPNQGKKTKDAQRMGHSIEQLGIPQVLHGSSVPPYDGKGSPGPAGPPGDRGKSSQDSEPQAQQPFPPPPAAPTSSTITPSPGHPSSGALVPGGAPGSPGTKGDQGPPDQVTLQSSPQQGQTDTQSFQQEPSQATLSPDSATSSLTLDPSSQPGKADGGHQGSHNNAHSDQSNLIHHGAALSQRASVSGLVPSSSGSLGSDTIQHPKVQLAAQDNQQSAQQSQQTLSATKMSAPPVQSSDSDVSGGGGVGASSMHGQIAASSKSAMLAQTSSRPSTGSAASGSHVSGGGQQVQNIPEIEWDIELPPRKNGIDDDQISINALSDDVDRVRYPQGVYPPKYPITGPQTSGKARTQSGRMSYQDTLQDMSDSSDSFDSHDADESFEHFNFTIAPYDGFARESYIPQCRDPWYVDSSSIATTSATPSPPPDYDHLPSPQTVREMLYWLVGFVELGYIGFIQKHVEHIFTEINNDASRTRDTIDIAGDLGTLTASHVTATVKEACLYAATVICRLKHNGNYNAYGDFQYKSEYSKLRYSSDPAGLLCKLRDYAYACHYQLQFLKSQCSRNESRGGWKNCEYGSEAKMPSPLQAFLTDAYDSKFKTHLFDPCNICLKSRVRIGFKKEDLPKISQQGSILSSFLTPSCGDDDPLLTLSSNLTCLTGRTPRTTGELVSYFHNFGKPLYDASLKTLSKLGSSLSTPHANCPNWDQLGDSDLQAVQGIRGYETLNSKHNHGNDHSNTLSTLVGCCSDSANCPQYCSPITYRAYSLYSPTFAHTYLSWAVYLPERLWESLERLRYDFKTHTCSEPKSFHQCSAAMPLLYTHGFMPPEGKLQWPLTCSEIIVKLKTVVNGGPIASLMTAMDNFLYRVRMPFIYTLIALWSVAVLLLSYTILYRLDVLYLCSHAIRSKASHLIDVKALLTNSRKMLSLYDADYFDDDPNDLVDQLK